MATVPKINLKIPQGTTYVHEFNYVDSSDAVIDLTGYSARLQFREEVTDVAFFYEALSGADLIIDPLLGRITLTISATDTAAFTVAKGVYDLEIIAPSTSVTRIVKGSVAVDPEVTR